MLDDNDLSNYIRRLAALIRAWCPTGAVLPLDEKWMLEQFAAWLWKDPTCARRLRAAGLAQGVEDRGCIASDCLGEILARDPKNALAQLLENVLGECDAVLVSTARRRITWAAPQKLYHRWAESDPVGAKIDRLLWDELKKRPDLYVLLPDSTMSPCYVTMARGGRLRENRPEISCDEMVRLIAEVWKGRREIPACVRRVLEIVREDSQWCALVRIDDVLFEAFCEAARLGIMRSEEIRFTPVEMSPDVTRTFEAARSAMLERIADVIVRYVKDRKLTAEIGTGMLKAVGMIYDEFGLSGDRDVDYKPYVLNVCRGLCEADYSRLYRSIFQYLMRLAKETLDDEFRKRWGS